MTESVTTGEWKLLEDEQYYDLAEFLVVWCSQAHFEGITVEGAAARYAARSTASECRRILGQGTEILSLRDFPWRDIAAAAQRRFETPDEARRWLERVLAVVRARPAI
jgi:hypothetical protein